ncbi:hypothetical protein GVN18_39630 [Pseudomonas sp. ODNR1LW]|nr:hypothetical protein [Pseudomonas sp. ODNR1LW]
MAISDLATRQLIADVAAMANSRPKVVKVQNPVRVADSEKPIKVLDVDQSRYEKLKEQSRLRIENFFAQRPHLIIAAEAAVDLNIPSQAISADNYNPPEAAGYKNR